MCLAVIDQNCSFFSHPTQKLFYWSGREMEKFRVVREDFGAVFAGEQ
jgi:hypothetical protein